MRPRNGRNEIFFHKSYRIKKKQNKENEMVELLLGISLTINFIIGIVVYYIYKQSIRIIRAEKDKKKQSLDALVDALNIFGAKYDA